MMSEDQANLSFDIKTAKAADLKTVKLSKFKFVHYIAGGLGSTGVFLANTGEGWVVFKQVGTRSGGEILASYLGTELGVRCPDYRIHEGDNQSELVMALKFAKAATEQERVILRNARIQAVIAMSFIEGFTLPACGMKVLKESSAPTLFRQFGEMSVLDLITNNFDRIPFVWSNQGNLENLMIRGNVMEDDGNLSAVSIDQGTTCITHEKGEAEYREKIVAGIKEAYGDVDVTGRTFKRFKMSFENNTGYEFTQADCENYFMGIRYGCDRLKKKMEEDPDFVFHQIQKTIDFLTPLEGTGFQCGLGLLNGDFIQKNVEAIIQTSNEAEK
eukprot:m.61772 g.61772  ORF g.61772 m.61772 type:complete len:329 (-) comp8005_c1_seq1:320-1306(-)